MSTSIEWTDETWNPVAGCSRVSSGCDHCYAIPMAHRLKNNPVGDIANGYEDTTRRAKQGTEEQRTDWTGVVQCREDQLEKPLSWQKPRRVFVASMGDLFHPAVPFEFIDRVFAVMALAEQHTFQVLTKRPWRMASYLTGMDNPGRTRQGAVQHRLDVWYARGDMRCDKRPGRRFQLSDHGWPLPNVWLGTSCENQETARERVPELLRCPAAVRFLSLEPLLGLIELDRWLWSVEDVSRDPYRTKIAEVRRGGLHQVIVGGESGHGARPMHPRWARSLRQECERAGVAFFFKQWGTWVPYEPAADPPFYESQHGDEIDGHILPPGLTTEHRVGEWLLDERFEMLYRKVSKKAAGRALDGRTHDAFPAADGEVAR